MTDAVHLAAERQAYLRRHGLIGLVLGVAGIIGCALGYGAEDHRRFLAGYVVAFMFWLGLSLGSLVIAALHGVTGGGWGLAVRRIAEAGYSTLPLMAIFFIPLAINVGQLYPWANSSTVAADELLQRKAWWLNVEGWQIRAAIYFGVWIVTMLLLNLLSPNDDPNSESPRGLWLQRVSGAGLIAYGFSITLASVDWVMSLEPRWYSSIYGVIYMGGQTLAGMSFAVLMACLLQRFPPWNAIVTTGRRHDLGNLLLTMVMFWAYVSFMQYLIIWSGDLPEENAWYLARSVGGYELVAIVLLFLHFGLPFLLLLSRDLKQHRQRLMMLVAWLLLMRLVDLYRMAMPAFYPRTLTLPWQMWAALVGIGGFWMAVFAWRLSARIGLPIYDPVLAEPEGAASMSAGHSI
jgi:hypothetical protein